MTRMRLVAVLVGGALLLSGCSGSNKPASRSDAREDIERQLRDVGYVANEDADPVPVSNTNAAAMASCVTEAMWDTSQFTKDERNEVTSTNDGSVPAAALVQQVQKVFADCFDDVSQVGPSLGDN